MGMTMHDLDLALLDGWQHGFPRVPRPFAALAGTLGCSEARVLEGYRRLAAQGAFDRIGGVWAPGAGGASLLCAMAVEPPRLDAVAAQVSACAGVNHNYAREHRFNLWFVLTAPDAAALEQALRTIEAATGVAALRLPMRRVYRIDLGFGLRGRRGEGEGARCASAVSRRGEPVAAADRALAAAIEAGLPLASAPYAALAQACGRTEPEVLATLEGWLARGTLRRFGVVVRHHELGYDCNAMTVFHLPEDRIDAHGERLAAQPGVTLAYRRAPAPGWPYALYAMVHGRSRDDTRTTLAAAMRASGLDRVPHEVLFSTRRYTQRGGRYFRALPVADLPAADVSAADAPVAAPPVLAQEAAHVPA